MRVENIICPNCGASLAPQPGQELITCTYCNSSLHLSTEPGVGLAVQPTSPRTTSPDATFRMTIEGVFEIHNRGTIVTGRVASGTLHIGDKLLIHRGNKTRRTSVISIEMFRKMLDRANAGDNVGVQLSGVTSKDVQRGDVLSSADVLDAN